MGTYFSISINAVENSTNIINNTSNVTVNLVCNCNNGWADDSPAYWIKVNGATVKSGTRNFDHETFTISWTGDVPHNVDGTGSCTYQGYFQGTDKPDGDTTSTYTLTLTTIDLSIPSRGLRVWLPLNGDVKNNGLDNITVTNNGATIDNAGKIGRCYSFDGSDDYIALSGDTLNPIFKGGRYPFSIAFWIKSQEDGTRGIVLSSYGLSSTSSFFSIEINSGSVTNNSLRFDWKGADIGYFSTVTLDTWCHFVVVYDGTQLRIYKDGALSASKDTILASLEATSNYYYLGRDSRTGTTAFSGKLNDVRIYDYALSDLEIKEISQALVVHYRLNDNLQVLNNCYSYPTFNTSSGAGGWSHWARSGASGTYGQNTDKKYIYNKSNTYSHWVQNASTATAEYLTHQSPVFEGGIRSLQAIIKEENSLPIDESIVFPAWNARNGGAENNKWTSITHLGEGFYLCKCEGISQDGSNDLVGLYVTPGHKVYYSEAYLENNREYCSDILFPRNYVVDSSGYGHNGTIVGSVTKELSAGRYEYSSHMNNTSSTNHIEFDSFNITGEYTFSFWLKASLSKNQCIFADNVNNFEFGILGGYFYTIISPASAGWSSSKFVTDAWNHIVLTYDGTVQKLYVNGAQETTRNGGSNNYIHNATNPWILNRSYNTTYAADASLSDFRIYTTALSNTDILSLYQTSAKIDDKQNTHAYEFNDSVGESDFVNGLVCHYRMTDLTYNICKDSSGNEHHLSYIGTPTVYDGAPKLANSIHFKNGDYGMGAESVATYMPKNAITISLWVKMTTWGNPISCTEGGGWNIENGGGSVRFPVNIKSTGYVLAYSGLSTSYFTDNTWHMIVATCDTTIAKIYVDGELKGSAATGNSINYAGVPLMLAAEARNMTSAESSAMVGELSDVRVYDYAFTADQVQNLYNITTPQKQRIYKNGVVSCEELFEDDNAKFVKDGIIESIKFIEI